MVSSEDLSYRELMGWVAHGLGVAAPSKPLAGWMLGLAWRGATVWSSLTGKPAQLTRDMAKNTRVQHRYNTAKVRGALPGFTFTPIREVVKKPRAVVSTADQFHLLLRSSESSVTCTS